MAFILEIARGIQDLVIEVEGQKEQTDQENEATLKAWMQKNGINDQSVTFFLGSAVLDEARKQAILDLDIPTT